MSILDNGTYIIAEIGVNHNGSLELAKQLVDAAKECGASAAKFQTFKAANIVSKRGIEKAPYQTRERSEDQYTMLERLELSHEDFVEIRKFTEQNGLDFISTGYDDECIDMLDKIGTKIFKVASADLVNRPLLDKLVSLKKTIILSTGMATMQEIERSIKYILDNNTNQELYLLHCTTSYPVRPEDVNMNFLETLADAFGLPVGYSDHTPGIEISLMAVSMGAKIIEKHFTLDRAMDGPDHFASIEPSELKALVDGISNIEAAFGSSEKIITPEEKINKGHMRRSIHCNGDLPIGKIIEIYDLKFTRPLEGIELWDYKDVLGKKLKVDKKDGEPLEYDDIE